MPQPLPVAAVRRLTATSSGTDDGVSRRPAVDADRTLIESAVRQSFLREVDDDLMAAIVGSSAIVSAAGGAIVYGTTGATDVVVIVAAGLTRAFATSPDGRQITVLYGRPGGPALVRALARGRAAPVSIQALEPTIGIEIPASLVQEAAAADPSISLALAAELQSLILEGFAAMGASAIGSVRGMLAWHLLQLAGPTSPDGPVTIDIAQRDLAAIVGSAREVVARALGVLRAEGVVETGPGGITLADSTRLASIAASVRPVSHLGGRPTS
ncbi:MAG TPA: Crp/Fnr family transcriptional regulator [Candidatus Dormibacteraeota bacterium]|nr:Crp/Fnr family transcriptional regulator [Candidatus Dormibacteraeota bacterium]